MFRRHATRNAHQRLDQKKPKEKYPIQKEGKIFKGKKITEIKEATTMWATMPECFLLFVVSSLSIYILAYLLSITYCAVSRVSCINY